MKSLKRPICLAIIATFSIPIILCIVYFIVSSRDCAKAEAFSTNSENHQTEYLNNVVASRLLEQTRVVYDTTYSYDTLICRLKFYQSIYDTIIWSKNDIGEYICQKFVVIIDPTLKSVDIKCSLIASNISPCLKINGDGNMVYCYVPVKRIPDDTYENGFVFNYDSDTIWALLKLTKETITSN